MPRWNGFAIEFYQKHVACREAKSGWGCGKT